MCAEKKDMADSYRNLEGVRILLIEDNEPCRMLVSTIMDNEGALTTAFPEASAALDILRDKASDFDAIITDLKLPGMDGLTFLKYVRENIGQIPIIIITGYSSVGSAVDALKLGAQDYIVKPLGTGEKLIMSVRRAVDFDITRIRNEKLQEEIRESENCFRALFHNTHDALFLCTVDQSGETGRFLEVNATACDLLKYSRSTLLEKRMCEITDGPRINDTVRGFDELVKNGSSTFETVLAASDGSPIHVEINAQTFEMENATVAISSARDIGIRRNMENKITEASETVYRNIGREVHDKISQSLTSIGMIAGTILKNPQSLSTQDIRLIREMSSEALDYTRRLCSGLFPAVLEDIGLNAALAQLAEDQKAFSSVSCAFSNGPEVDNIDNSTALHIFRIAQEAVNNAVKHSGAEHIYIKLGKQPDGQKVLTVEDDGKGITHRTNHNGNGIGMHLMKYRAGILGASLEITNRRPSGSRIICSWK